MYLCKCRYIKYLHMAHSSSSKPHKHNTPQQVKRKSITVKTENEKILVSNVFKHVQETWPTEYPMLCQTEMKMKTAQILGLTKSTVYRVLNCYKQNDVSTVPKKRLNMFEKMDDVKKSLFKKIVQEFHAKGELTLDKLCSLCLKDKILPKCSRSSLRRMFKQLEKEEMKDSSSVTISINTKTNGNYSNDLLQEENGLKPVKVYIKSEILDENSDNMVAPCTETSVEDKLKYEIKMENPDYKIDIDYENRVGLTEDFNEHKLDEIKVKIQNSDVDNGLFRVCQQEIN